MKKALKWIAVIVSFWFLFALVALSAFFDVHAIWWLTKNTPHTNDLLMMAAILPTGTGLSIVAIRYWIRLVQWKPKVPSAA